MTPKPNNKPVTTTAPRRSAENAQVVDKPTEEQLEEILIDLYETAQLHGEAAVNGVLPSKTQREQTILIPLNELLALLTASNQEAYAQGKEQP
jgi:hypothetical protein